MLTGFEDLWSISLIFKVWLIPTRRGHQRLAIRGSSWRIFQLLHRLQAKIQNTSRVVEFALRSYCQRGSPA